MITVKFRGGLGNQMFQYAAGRALAGKLGTEVVADLRWYRKHAAALGRIGLTMDRPFDLLDLALPPLRVKRRVSAWTADRLARLGLGHQFKENGLGFDARLLDVGDGSAITGYFQCEAYFSHIREDLRQAFTPRAATVRQRVAEALAQLRARATPLVAVHVRRGDYVQPGGKSLAIAPDRILAAMARFQNVTFLVFSDDVEWCQHNIVGGSVLMSPLATPIEDFWAMLCCDHFIIANSTFSWWAAWLSGAENKRVLAPNDWYCIGASRTSAHDAIYAAGWERY